MSAPTTFWRIAGMTYMGYVSRATGAMRNALKEPARTQAMGNNAFNYNRSTFNSEGVQSAKTNITTLEAAGK